jgi:hypothetical protein
MKVPDSLYPYNKKEELESFLANEIGISIEEFKRYFELAESSRTRDIVLKAGYFLRSNTQDEYGSTETDKIRKRFKKGESASLNPLLIQKLQIEIEEAKERNAEYDRVKKIFREAESLVKDITDKYDEETDLSYNEGISITFLSSGASYYDKKYNRAKYFGLYIEYSPKCLGEGEYFFVKERKGIDGKVFYDRYYKLMNVTINNLGVIEEIQFELLQHYQDGTRHRLLERDTQTLDKLIKFTDASILWQVELSDFAEQIKKEINPKFWELGKEL